MLLVDDDEADIGHGREQALRAPTTTRAAPLFTKSH